MHQCLLYLVFGCVGKQIAIQLISHDGSTVVLVDGDVVSVLTMVSDDTLVCSLIFRKISALISQQASGRSVATIKHGADSSYCGTPQWLQHLQRNSRVP